MDTNNIDTTESHLLNEARDFLQSQQGRIARVAADTGLTVRFLQNLHQGLVDDPGVRKIERLLRYKAQLGETLTSTALR